MALTHTVYASTQLSFDDGPGPSTPALLDVLRRASCRATFFVLGQNVQKAPEIAMRIVREGHVLANHTWSHARPGALSEAELLDEVHATDALIRHAWQQAGRGEPNTIPLRLPYGLAANDVRLSALACLGRSHVGWTAIFDDWRRPAPCAHTLSERMREHIRQQTARGQKAFLCLHDGSRHGEARPQTVEAVRLLLQSGGGCPT